MEAQDDGQLINWVGIRPADVAVAFGLTLDLGSDLALEEGASGDHHHQCRCCHDSPHPDLLLLVIGRRNQGYGSPMSAGFVPVGRVIGIALGRNDALYGLYR